MLLTAYFWMFHCQELLHPVVTSIVRKFDIYMSRHMRFPTTWYVRPAKPQISSHISLRIFAVGSDFRA